MGSAQINLNNVCRTCKSESPEMKSLYHRESESDQENTRLDEMLMACTTVQVNCEDNLPKVICRACFVQLKNAYCFKEQCEKTDVFLRDYLKDLNGTKQKVPLDEREYASNIIADNNTNIDKDIAENIRNDPESPSGYKDVDYVQIFRDLTVYKCRTCCKNFYTIQSLSNHKKVQHNIQLDVVHKISGLWTQSDEKEYKVESANLDMGGDIIEPKIEVSENNDQDKIDKIAQVTNDIYTEENRPEMGIIENEMHQEHEEIEGETNIDAGIEYKSEGNADSECLSRGAPPPKIKRGRGDPRKYPIGYQPTTGGPRERPPRIHECETCNKKFSEMSGLRRHKRSHLDVKPYVCVICAKCFARKDNLTTHMKVHSRTVTYNCHVCEMVFYKEENLVRHKAYKHYIGKRVPVKEKKFKCEYCEKGFTTEMNRDTHMQAHFVDKKFECETCEKTFTSKKHLTEHMKLHNGSSKKFLCTECGQRFIRNSYLVMHMRRHRGEEPFKCKFCGKGFLRTSDLKVHERYHTGEKTHLCVICGKGFVNGQGLTRHMPIHTGEKRHRCTYCDAAFIKSADLKVHVRIHTGERFQCELCPKTFRLHHLLTKHKRDVHGLNIVSNIRRLQRVYEINPDDPPLITAPLPTSDIVVSAIPSDPLQIEESDMPELKQE